MLKTKLPPHYLRYANWIDSEFYRKPIVIYQNISHASIDKKFFLWEILPH